jgi:hypothetical protein
VKLFDDLKEFVERIPSKAFAPYFTTDLRQMTGRYYRERTAIRQKNLGIC